MIGSGYRTASTNSGDRNDPYFQRLDPEGEIIPIADDLDAFSTGSDAGDAFIMLTNWQAPRRRVIRVEFANPSRENWREIIPEGPSTIESVATVGGKLVVTYIEDVHSRVRVFEPDGTFVRDVDLPGARHRRGIYRAMGTQRIVFLLQLVQSCADDLSLRPRDRRA